MKTDDALSQVFNTNPMEVITVKDASIVPNTEVESITDDEALQTDYDEARDNLKSLLVQGKDALDYALRVAKEDQSPRSFEVVGLLVKQLADVNHQLLDLTDKKKKIKTPESGPQTVNNNAYFVGSTADLNRMLKELKGGGN